MDKLFSGKLNKHSPAVAVIMAGGSGTRFWPLSRTNRPKQFLPLAGSDRSLIQATSDRIVPFVSEAGVLVVTASHQAELVRNQLPAAAVLSEPVAKNTAPCIGYAAIRVLHDVGDVPMLCMPADHLIKEEAELRKVLQAAAELAAKEDVIVTVGIKPTHPETGYGYIRRGAKKDGAANAGPVFSVESFVEKPDRPTAEKYLASGEYFWNGGMFVWRPSVALKEIRRHLPKLSAGLDEIAAIWKSGDGAGGDARIAEIYASFESISIDFGIMERAENVLVISGEKFQWSDVGSWASWADEQAEKLDADGNFTRGDVVMVDSRGCYVLGNGSRKKLIAGVGLKDLIIVETDDAILICSREHSQDVKQIVDGLKAKNRKELL